MSDEILSTDSVLKSEIEKVINKYEWYHIMDLGFGLSTPGAGYRNLIPVAVLMRNIEFKGLKTLDISTMDGKMAFLMEKLGADKIIATDVFKKDTLVSLISLFGSRVECEFGISDRNIDQIYDKYGSFDFVLCIGVLYHIYSPINLILNIRRAIRNGGYVIFESECIPDERSLIMRFNRNDMSKDITTIWLPSIACLRYMIMYSCFRIIAEATLYRPLTVRHAILAQAQRPAELKISHRNDALLETLYSDPNLYPLPPYNMASLERGEDAHVAIRNIKRYHTKINLKAKKSFLAEEEFLKFGTPAKVNKNHPF